VFDIYPLMLLSFLSFASLAFEYYSSFLALCLMFV
jgi:hypothetical protein